MKHDAVKRLVPAASTAVLFVHGILGTPRYFDGFVARIPETYSVHNLLLAGHGGTVADFGRASMAQWRQQVREALIELRGSHRRVLVVAHSLGTLLTLQALIDEPGLADALFLLAVPLRIFPKPRTALTNILVGLGATKPASPAIRAAQEAYGTDSDWRVWRYIPWIPRYLELFAQSAAIRRMLPRLTVPTQAYMSARDDLVSMRSCKALQKAACVTVTVLPESGHYHYAAKDRALLLERFTQMMDEQS
ncbi:MAG: alpha/beta hydrolase [Clostridia bacterium]|nr:alpha/beta hydrolase [Clostridia bacterium]